MEDLFLQIAGHSAIWQGLVAGLVIAFLNMVGALAIMVIKNPSERLLDAALGGAAGVMLAASFTSLILPGIEMGGIIPVLIGITLGTIFLDFADKWVPHVHILLTGRIRKDQTDIEKTKNGSSFTNTRLGGLVLFMLAITLHNMPEGLAVGVAFGSENLGNALSLMLAIGIQNIPEGFAVAVAAKNAGLGSRFYAGFVGIRAGLVEIPLAVFGAALVSIVEPLVPYAMGFAAGAMIFVISDEIIPETHAKGNERIATLGLMVGLIIMLTLDIVLA